jgi:hypothetical protein|tara:strand:+ start:349 stop:636 length:288 start_codon:yes stop_codon:yes gene_type:complete
MRKFLLMAILCFSAPFVLASGHDLLDEEACKKTKEGIGYFLGVADYLFKETEKNNKTMQTEEEKKANEEELLGGAIAFSQLAANYSTVYEVWCKD